MKKRNFILTILLTTFAFFAQAQTTYVYSNADDGFLNIRMKPSASSEIVGVLYNGKEGAKLLDKSNKYWYRVSKDGIVGYVNKRYAKLNSVMVPADRRQEQQPVNGFEKLQVGMSTEECKRICGKPDKINKQVYSNRIVEFWEYKNPKCVLHFRNGFLDNFSYQAK
jgi:hypothetical protein